MQDIVKPLEVQSTWQGLLNQYKNLVSQPPTSQGKEQIWLYRANTCTCLMSSLDKALGRTTRTSMLYPDLERFLLREFQRRYHHYASSTPVAFDYLQWLAIMQHYGAPTRLLDWTYSFYVAAYFALNRSFDEVHHPNCNFTNTATGSREQTRPMSHILAVEVCEVRRRSNRKLLDTLPEGHEAKARLSKDLEINLLPAHNDRESRNAFAELVMKNHAAFVYPATPFHLNERLSAQQGTFLCAGSVGANFQDNLFACVGDQLPVPYKIVPLLFSDEEKRNALNDLRRMNISQTTLFPGLGGFSESLTNHWALLDNSHTLETVPISFE